MEIVFIHGIHQDGKDPTVLKTEWLSAISESQKGTSNLTIAEEDIAFPFYGDLLGNLTLAATGKSRSFETRTSETGATERVIDSKTFREFWGETEKEMVGSVVPTPRGKGIHKSSFKFIAKGIESISPFKGRLALKLLKQAYAYIHIPEIQKLVNDKVRPFLETETPKIIISHSLGTIVAYKILLDLSKQEKLSGVPLFMTLGSPLSLKIVMNKLQNATETIQEVSKWVNGSDKEDFIALGNRLDENFYKMSIENISNLENGEEDPHSIEKYLSHKRITDHIFETWNL
jgi:hypothetical protein